MASAAAGAQRRIVVMLWTALLIGWIVPFGARPPSVLAAPPPSPLDALDASRIDPKDRVVDLPAELVALLGSNRGRHSEPVKCLTVSPDGQSLASGSRDQTVRLWDPATLTQRQVLTGYHGDVNSVVFAPDSKRLFSTSEDGKVHVHERNEGRWTPSKSIPLMPRGSAVVFPDAKTVLSSAWPPTNEDLQLFRIFDSRVESAHPALAGLIQWPEGGAALSGDGRWLACGGTGKAGGGLEIGVSIWDLRDRSSRPRWMLDMPSGHIHSVAFSPDGRTLLVGDDNGEIALWSFGESEPEKRGQFVAHKDAVNVLVFSPDGKKLLSGAYDHQIGVWAWQEGQAKRLGTLTGHSDWIGSLAFSPDGRTLYSGGWDHIVRRWTAAGNSFVPADEFRGHSHPVDAIAFSPDGSRIACGALSSLAGRSEESPANEVRVWRLGGTVPEPEAVLSGCTGWIQKLAFSQSGKLLAASSDAGITRWRVPEWSVAKQLPADEKGDPTFRPEIGYAKFVLRGKLSGLKPMQAAAFAPDRRLLATGHCDHGIYLWQLDGEKLQSRQVLVGHQSSVGALDFSPRGQLLASGGWDGQLVIWNVAARTMKKSWQLPGRIWDVRFAPDGRHLAVGDGTGVVYVLRLKL